MSRIRSFCNRDFDSMADYIRHLPRCVLCAAAHVRR